MSILPRRFILLIIFGNSICHYSNSRLFCLASLHMKRKLRYQKSIGLYREWILCNSLFLFFGLYTFFDQRGLDIYRLDLFSNVYHCVFSINSELFQRGQALWQTRTRKGLGVNIWMLCLKKREKYLEKQKPHVLWPSMNYMWFLISNLIVCPPMLEYKLSSWMYFFFLL